MHLHSAAPFPHVLPITDPSPPSRKHLNRIIWKGTSYGEVILAAVTGTILDLL